MAMAACRSSEAGAVAIVSAADRDPPLPVARGARGAFSGARIAPG